MIEDAPRPAPTAAERRHFFTGLAVVLGLTACVWIGYGRAQPRYDPRHTNPGFDGAYYLDWSDSILSADDQDPRFEGAFYRAPLYPYLLSVLRGPFGAGLAAVRWIQMLAALVATGWLAHHAFRWGGPIAGIGAAVLLGGYHPWLFFSSRLLVESWAIVLLAAALPWIARHGIRWTIPVGVMMGLASLGRPNLLLVVAGWAAWAVMRGDRTRGIVLLLATVVTVLPVTAVNWHRSGRLVPISGNGGLTLYHGNGPGAEGVFKHPAGMSGDVGVQRQEATAMASRLAARALDPVDADRYWGREAVRQRVTEPIDTLRLGWNRLALLLGTREIALDEAPALDPNPWSRATFVPFALLVALAAAAAVSGKRAEIAAWSWIAIAACAATPLIFYASARYRLPFAVLLTVPAGVGMAELFKLRRAAIAVALAAFAFSLGVPWIVGLTMPHAEIWRAEQASGLARLADGALKKAATSTTPAERDRWEALAHRSLERGRETAPDDPELLGAVARLARNDGRLVEAEDAWRRAWSARDGALAARINAAVNLSAILVTSGRASAAADMMSEAVELAPLNENCWHNHIVALVAAGRPAEARRTVERAHARGIPVDPELEAELP